jgi:hypothetical protein
MVIGKSRNSSNNDGSRGGENRKLQPNPSMAKRYEVGIYKKTNEIIRGTVMIQLELFPAVYIEKTKAGHQRAILQVDGSTFLFQVEGKWASSPRERRPGNLLEGATGDAMAFLSCRLGIHFRWASVTVDDLIAVVASKGMMKPEPIPPRHTCRQPEWDDVFPPGMPWEATHNWGMSGDPVQVVFVGGRYFYRYKKRGGGSGNQGSWTFFGREIGRLSG